MNITVSLITVCFISFLIGHTNETDICGGQIGTTCCAGYQWNDTLRTCIRCEKGFSDINCTIPCRFPTYGLDCQLICHCSIDACHFADGCNETTTLKGNDILQRSTSRDSLDDEMKPNIEPTKMTIGTIVLATVAFSILLVILFTYRVEKRIGSMNHLSQYV